ncbi:hypothetical protein [Natrarchaeobius chitinivorans]|uniref:HTTM-like domain-containing protein n=1 Tax=Natrarchaeobius chitinivorans TaxID=1679083 RepID=A0A3N6PIF2_NATCH|nr:hypothetical protein [Natrarchaeobius chitinivorans]RQG98045.1 hypothetical protein EA473_02320 [Natrarchaeobius chitinivorans]
MTPSLPTAVQSRRLRDTLERRVGIDQRALATFRITLGVVLLFDVVHRSRNLVAFYTDDGVLPRAVHLEGAGWDGVYSLHSLSGEPWFQAFLFGLSAILAVALIAGYRPRLAAALSLILLVSVHLRNPHVLNGADRLFRELLFLSIFLPIGSRWAIGAGGADASDDDPTNGSSDDEPANSSSVDTVDAGDDDTAGASDDERTNPNDDDRTNANDDPVESRTTTPVTAAVLVYVVTVLFNNAVHKFAGETWVGGDALRYALGQDHLTILLGTHLANQPVLLEVGTYVWFGLLAGSPLLFAFGDRLRIGYVSVFLAAVGGMALSMAVGLFPPLLAASMILFLPPRTWTRLESVGTWTRLESARTWTRFEFAGSASRERLSSGAGRLSKGAKETSTAKPEGKGSSRRVRRRLRSAGRWLVLVVVVVWCVGLFGSTPALELADGVNPEEHQWGMFAPDPSASYGWYTVAADLEEDEAVDVLAGSELRADPPPDAAETIPDFRWRRYMNTLAESDARDDRFAEYACERVATQHDATVESVNVTYTHQPVELEGETPEPTTRVVVENRSCS